MIMVGENVTANCSLDIELPGWVKEACGNVDNLGPPRGMSLHPRFHSLAVPTPVLPSVLGLGWDKWLRPSFWPARPLCGSLES